MRNNLKPYKFAFVWHGVTKCTINLKKIKLFLLECENVCSKNNSKDTWCICWYNKC